MEVTQTSIPSVTTSSCRDTALLSRYTLSLSGINLLCMDEQAISCTDTLEVLLSEVDDRLRCPRFDSKRHRFRRTDMKL